MDFKSIIIKIAQNANNAAPAAASPVAAEVPMVPPVPEFRDKGEDASKKSPTQTSSIKNKKNSISNKSSIVKDMQQAIIEVGNAASQINTSSMGNAKSKNTQVDDLNSPTSNEENSVGGFVTSNFITPKTDSGNDVAPKSLSDIIQTIKTVGTPGLKGGASTADGVWKGMTQEALKNISTLVAGFLDFALSMGLKTTSYTPQDIPKFNNNLALGYPKFGAPVEQTAKSILLHLNAMKSFLLNLNQEIVKNPNIKNQISGRKSLSRYKQVKNEVPAGFEKQYLEFPNAGYSLKRKLQLSDLEDLAHFKDWLSVNGYKDASEDTVKKWLASLTTQLG